jgi:hypothetical protein
MCQFQWRHALQEIADRSDIAGEEDGRSKIVQILKKMRNCTTSVTQTAHSPPVKE